MKTQLQEKIQGNNYRP